MSLNILVWLVVGCSSIHHAVKHDDLNSVKSYVSKGYIEKCDRKYGLTPLILAAYYNHYDIAKYLLDQGARVDVRDNSGRTALIYAASYNYLDMAMLLLEHKASVLIQDQDGYNAMDYAQTSNFTEMIALLDKYRQNANETPGRELTKNTNERTREVYSPASPVEADRIEAPEELSGDQALKNNQETAPAPSLEIHEISIKPSPVTAGQEFTMEVEYTVTDPAVKAEHVPVQFSFEILRGATSLFNIKQQALNSFNGSATRRIEKLKSSSKRATYTIQVSIGYGEIVTKKSLYLQVK